MGPVEITNAEMEARCLWSLVAQNRAEPMKIIEDLQGIRCETVELVRKAAAVNRRARQHQLIKQLRMEKVWMVQRGRPRRSNQNFCVARQGLNRKTGIPF
jgi:hypothetical protein